jgi:predicted metal-binding protein
MQKYIDCAKELGFSGAAVIPVSELPIVPEYRKYCVENLCGNYGKLKACPPESGTVEEMEERVRKYQNALILQTTVTPNDIKSSDEAKKIKHDHNVLTEKLLDFLHADGKTDVLMMSAGPWKTNSCMSAYSVDAQKTAEAAGMKCWENDGKIRCFSLLLFN